MIDKNFRWKALYTFKKMFDALYQVCVEVDSHEQDDLAITQAMEYVDVVSGRNGHYESELDFSHLDDVVLDEAVDFLKLYTSTDFQYPLTFTFTMKDIYPENNPRAEYGDIKITVNLERTKSESVS